jgi:formylglycine-generating enzyme required for sulfatase activity
MRTAFNVLTLAALLIADAGCGPPSGSVDSPKPAPTSADSLPSSTMEIVSKSGIEMVYLPGGGFTMGDAGSNPDEAPPHQIVLSPFLMDKFEVTQEMFARAQLPNPSHWQDNPKNPVERVRWRDAKQYCNERSLLEGLAPCYDEKSESWNCNYDANGYRLPTEAEWEYACRAGSSGPYDFGSSDKLRQYAWIADNAGERTHAVGQKRPNHWGLHDLYGNVAEWCEDVYDPGYYKQSPPRDPRGPPESGKDTKRVIRGGSWKASSDMARASFRQGQRTGDTDACFYTDFCGFRCVRRITASELEGLRDRRK